MEDKAGRPAYLSLNILARISAVLVASPRKSSGFLSRQVIAPVSGSYEMKRFSLSMSISDSILDIMKE